MSPEARNYVQYAALALGAFLVGSLTALVPQLMDPTMPALNWRTVLGTGITAVLTAYGGSLLPRSGSTGLARQVDALKADGVPKSDMVVVSQEQADRPAGPSIHEIADELERRRRERVEARLREVSNDG
jgi:hypothetical protein